MDSGWAAARALSKKATEDSSTYVKLANDGDAVTGVFCGEPLPRYVHWVGASYEECAGTTCKLCAEDVRAVPRFAFNFYVLDERRMKIIEGTNAWFIDVDTVADKYGLDNWAFEIRRKGAAGYTKTKYSILPDQQLNAAQRQEVQACKLLDLSREAASAARDAYEASANGNQVAVSTDVARSLHERLRSLNKEDVVEFFAQFDIKRVSELRACDVAKAKAFIADHEDLPF